MIYLAARPELYVIVGLSSETKPTNVVSNSVFLEVDTGDWWIYTAAVWSLCGKQPH